MLQEITSDIEKMVKAEKKKKKESREEAKGKR